MSYDDYTNEEDYKKDEKDETLKYIRDRFAEAKMRMEAEAEDAGMGFVSIQPCEHCIVFFNRGIQAGLDKAMEVINKPVKSR